MRSKDAVGIGRGVFVQKGGELAAVGLDIVIKGQLHERPFRTGRQSFPADFQRILFSLWESYNL